MQSARPASPVAALHGAFFLSGAGALAFETVWFSQAGLVVGNSVWCAALVAGAFMAGLALGNGIAMRLSPRLASPLRAYAIAEIVAAASGLALVAAFPALPSRPRSRRSSGMRPRSTRRAWRSRSCCSASPRPRSVRLCRSS